MFEMYYYFYILVFLSSFNCYVLHLLILKVVYIYSTGMCGITLQSVQKKYVLHSLSKFGTVFSFVLVDRLGNILHWNFHK